MPREARPPRVNARLGGSQMSIPLNDDREEKSKRLQSRQALQEMQMNQIKATASPIRKRKSMGVTGTASPGNDDVRDKENDGFEITNVGGNAVSPAKRVPILANFEEWMKMATDNKINANNSWNFALIDYFHDMSLLKEGDGVNFQKASCTLDGCVKIYTSRVDSMATETGKLLTGLADSGNRKARNDNDEKVEGDDDEEEEDGEDGTKKKPKKRTQRSSETTLAASFGQLQLKKMELEFAVDPLFKKASADFDEGGAKGLLLNHLTIDAHGRIVFDSSDDVQQTEGEPVEEPPNEHADDRTRLDEDQAVDVTSLGIKFLPDLSLLDELDVCPSLKTFELGGGDEPLDIPFLKAPEDWRKEQAATKNSPENDPPPVDFGVLSGFDDDEGGINDAFDAAADVGFGEGGEAWAKDAAISTFARPANAEQVNEDELDPENGVRTVDAFKTDGTRYGVSLDQRPQNEQEINVLNYFDEALRKNWAGPEHWRINKVKQNTKPISQAPKRKEKVPFVIDFAAPMTQSMSDAIFTPAASNSMICLPRMQWRSKTRNLLPDDKHFNSRQLLRLFLKPKARIGAMRSVDRDGTLHGQASADERAMDEGFWARRQAEAETAETESQKVSGDYDANFFQDDGLGLPAGENTDNNGDDDDDEFADAQETLPPFRAGSQQEPCESQETADGSIEGGFGSQLVTQSRRIRPEYVQYARVAKKVDVRRLKEEMWKGLGLEEIPPSRSATEPPLAAPPDTADKPQPDNPTLNFTSVMNGLRSVYPAQTMCDISTSYGFICLLHLANEQGLILTNGADFEDIGIRKDFTAEITGID